MACQSSPKDASITVKQTGEMTVFGQAATDLESLKAILIDSLSRMATIPDKLDINFEGEVGMGLRQEVETIAAEAIEAAKRTSQAPALEQQALRKEQGAHCDKAQDDDTRMDCAQVDVMYHVVTQGNPALQDAVTEWTNRYLFSVLEANLRDSVQSTSLDEAVQAFFNTHNTYKKEAGGPAMAAGHFMAQTNSEVVLNNGEYLTLAMNGETFMGGAHGSPTVAMNTFAVETGKILTWDDLVTDQSAVKALAEQAVREEKAEVFEQGFAFDDIFKFELPANYGLTPDGIMLYYEHYEIMPYAFGATVVTLPFEKLGELAKIRL